MISSIGFLPNTQEIRELKDFEVNENVKSKLEYLSIPILPNEPSDDSEEMPVIKSTDNVLFCTPNTEEISNVAFYGYDDTEIYFHHDLFVFSTILDSCYVRDSFVAVATFEPDIFIYDFMLKFPVLPQLLLEGHEGPVTGIKNKEGKLVSCSDDKTVIEWDLNMLTVKDRKNVQVSIEKFDFESNSLVFGAKNFLNINDENISLDHNIEQLKIKDNFVYLSDCDGNLMIFDVRAPAKAMVSKKIHDDAVLDICLVNNLIVTSSVDKHVKVWELEGDLVCKNDMVQESVVYALGYNEFNTVNEVFAGNEEDFVYPILLEETITEN